MQGEQVILTDMLLCRERRAQIQDTFLSQYQAVNLSLLSVSYSHPILLFVPLYTLFISPFLFF